MARSERILRKLLDKIAKEQEYTDYHVEIKEISSGGANYTSALLLAKISEANKDDLNLFAKVATLGENMRSQMPIKIYDVEYYVYSNLADIYEKIQRKYSVPQHDRLILSKFYGASRELYEETIVLENLQARGFTTYDRFKSIDWTYASKAVETMAKFHALSFAYSQDNIVEFEDVIKKYKPVVEDSFSVDWLNTLAAQVVKVSKEAYKDRLQKYLDTYMAPENFWKFYTSLRCNVLVHADYRMSNLMHRVDENNKMEVIPVDFQTIRAGPPVTDLMYFIFTGSDQEFRAMHYEQLIEHYYQQLCRFLRVLYIDPEDVYSREYFEYELEVCQPFGMMSSVFGLPITTADENNAPVIDADADLSAFTVTKTSELYAQRINGVIDDYVKWGWL